MKISPLRHFPFYATRDPDFARGILSAYGVTAYDVVGDVATYEQRVNSIALREMSMYYSACSTTGIRVKFAAVGFMRQRVCFAGAGRSTSGKLTSDLNPRKWSAVVPAGDGGSFDFGAGYEELRMVVDDKVMRSKLGALVGDAPVDCITFTPNDDVRAPGLAQYRRLLTLLLSELEAGGPQAPGLVINEIAEALLVSYLHGQTHNFSHRLFKPDPAPSSTQQRLAEDFIAAHWNAPLTVEDIAKATNISVRSVFRSFKHTHGCSPFQYIKRVRLQHARAMLLDQESRSVISVALKCGFHSFGHFARSYRTEFGELPSQTVRR